LKINYDRLNKLIDQQAPEMVLQKLLTASFNVEIHLW